MSNNTRAITGPTSALTDYLAANQVSAAEIMHRARRRVSQAAREAAANNQDGEGQQEEDQDAEQEEEEEVEAQPAGTHITRSRTRQGETAAAKRKRTAEAKQKDKEKKKAKKDHDADLPNFWGTPGIPDQMENCSDCQKRFAVTPYTRSGPDGGFLCPECAAELDEQDKPKRPRARRALLPNRRKKARKILDGINPLGARSLLDLCIDTLVNHVELADDLGEIPDPLIDKIARRLSKRRLMDSNNLTLFARRDADTVNIYDCAKITHHDLISMLQTCPALKHLKLKNAIRFNDEVMAYLISRDIELESFSLHGASLLTGDAWAKFLVAKGHALKQLKVYFTDKHFDDSTLGLVAKHCTSLECIKIYHNHQVTATGIASIASIKTLTHVGINLYEKVVESRHLADLVKAIGPQIKTLSLREFPLANDYVLDMIHTQCTSLRKLRITGSLHMSDKGVAKLFTKWKNPALDFIDFTDCRHLNEIVEGQSTKKKDVPESLGSDGFVAILRHSKKYLKYLNVTSCRHIKREGMEKAFKLGTTYPDLEKLDLSFVGNGVDDYVVGLIFRACPKLSEVAVWGSMNVRDVIVPKGKIVQGVPTAKGMVIKGAEA